MSNPVSRRNSVPVSSSGFSSNKPTVEPYEREEDYGLRVMEEPDEVFIQRNQAYDQARVEDVEETSDEDSGGLLNRGTVGPAPDEWSVEDTPELSVEETPDEVVIDMPSMTPVTMHDVLKAFDDALKAELDQWERKYRDDPHGVFRQKIDSYIKSWIELMELKDAGASEEDLEPLCERLGTKLADAFGMLDPATGDWSREVKEAADRAGAEYAWPSVKAFMYTQLPSWIKSVISLYAGTFADEETASTVKHVTNFVYPFVQIPVAVKAAENNAAGQPGAVQQHKRELSTTTPNPNVDSGKIVKLDGTPGELRPLAHVHEDLEELKEASELVKSGDQGKLEQKYQKLVGQILLARAELEKLLAHTTATLGESLLQSRLKSSESAPPPLNDQEKKILDENLHFETRVDLLLKFISGRAAVPGPERKRAKRLLKQLKQWSMLQKVLAAAIESAKSGAPPERSQALQKAVVDMRFERMQTVRYRMLNVLSNQAIARDVRTAGFMALVLTQLSAQVAEYVTGDDASLLMSDALQVLLTPLQTLAYAVHYPKATAWDALNKLATQFQIIAMTGPGNFLDKDGKVDATKLNKVVTGPVQARVSTFESLLVFDRSVYSEAVLGWMVPGVPGVPGDKPQTLDNDKAKKVKVLLPGAQEEKDIPCTYTALADEFGKLKKPEDRKAFVDQVARQRPFAAANKDKIDRNLKLYENNEVSLANKRDMSTLLDERTSTLPPETREMFKRSLGGVVKTPLKLGTQKQLSEADREVFNRAGDIERKGDKNFQPSQKLGQALAWGIAGTTGFYALNSILKTGVEIAILHGELTQKAADALAEDILVGKVTTNLITLASLILQLGFNHAYHVYIANKALQRQNAAAIGGASIVNAPLPTLAGGIWEELMAMIGREDAREEEITGYETLVGTPIPKDDWPPKLKFVRPIPMTEAMVEQMFATSLKSWPTYFKEKHGELVGMTTEALEKAQRDNIDKLRELLKAEGVARPADDANDAKRSHSDDGRQKIEEVTVPPKVPPLNLSPINLPSNDPPPIKLPAIPKDVEIATPRSPRPQSPRNLRKDPLAPLLAAQTQNEKGRQLEGLGVGKGRRPHPLYTGVSKVGLSPSTYDPDYIVPLDHKEDEGTVPESSGKAVEVSPEARLMQELEWNDSDFGISVAQKGQVFYLSDPERTGPIPAYSIPDDAGSILHLVDHEYPTLAVSNMVQLDLGRHKNWKTLTTEGEFASFFVDYLRNPAEDPSMRVAEMPMPDLAVFTQQMTLQQAPDRGWLPMTTATVRYMPGTPEPIRSVATPPPALDPGRAFGVSYAARGFRGTTVRKAAMLYFDGSRYSVVDPTLSEPIDTQYKKPHEALQWYMQRISSQHPEAEIEFTVLYHVPPQLSDDNDGIRERVLKHHEPLEVLTEWATERDVVKARLEIGDACRALEAENSHLLLDAAHGTRDKSIVATQVMINHSVIKLLGETYSLWAESAPLPPRD